MSPLDPRTMRLMMIGVLALLASLIFIISRAHAMACGKRAEIVESLRKQHGERPYRIAMTSDGRVLELWARPDGQWTLLATSPKGYSCIQATGYSAWEDLPQGDPA